MEKREVMQAAAAFGEELARIVLETMKDTDYRDLHIGRVFMVNGSQIEPMVLVGALTEQTHLIGEMVKDMVPGNVEDGVLGFDLSVPEDEDMDRWLRRGLQLIVAYASGEFEDVAATIMGIAKQYEGDDFIREVLETWYAQLHIIDRITESGEQSWVKIGSEDDIEKLDLPDGLAATLIEKLREKQAQAE